MRPLLSWPVAFAMLLSASANAAAADAPSKEQISFDNAALCTAYFSTAADGAVEAKDDNADYFAWMAKEFKGVADFGGEKLGYKPELIESNIFTMTMTLMTQISVLDEAGFKKFDQQVNGHCIDAMPGMDGEFIAFAWPGNSSGEVK